MNYRLVILHIFCLLLNTVPVSAQSWQWGLFAGSSNHSGKQDNMMALTTDVHGNTYMAIDLESKGIFAGSVSLPDGKGVNIHTLLISHDCKGNYRWSKIIGGEDTKTKSLKVTNDGNVYLYGFVATGTLYNGYYDSDTTTPKVYQGISLICYDTMGNYKWLRRPDTITSASTNYQAISMDIDEAGNAYCLVSMPANNIILGTSLKIPATTPYRGLGMYVIKYDKNGTVLSVTMLKDISYTFLYGVHTYSRLTYNKFNGGFYLIGQTDLYPGNDSLFIKSVFENHNMYLMSFAADGSLKWYKTDTSIISGNAKFISPVILDKFGNLYFSGSLPHTDMLCGFQSLNPHNPVRNYPMPFIMKTDSIGNLIWAKNGGAIPATPYYGSLEGGVLAINQDYAAIGGTGGLKGYFGDPYIDTIEINKYKTGGPGADGWFAIVDLKTQKTVRLGTINGSGDMDGIRSIQFFNSDIFIGGNSNSTKDTVDKELIIDHIISGSKTDAFLTKYSLPCDCIAAPISSFDYTAGKFTFTGTSGADSVTWDFGDGTKAKGSTVTHSYSTKGKYTVCVTVWTKDCGKVKSCKEIDVTVSITDIKTTEGFLKIYPNPANDVLFIEGLTEGAKVNLSNILGQLQLSATSQSQNLSLNLSDLSGGVYFILIETPNGEYYTIKFSKQ